MTLPLDQYPNPILIEKILRKPVLKKSGLKNLFWKIRSRVCFGKVCFEMSLGKVCFEKACSEKPVLENELESLF